MDLYAHYEALYAELDAALVIPVVPVTSYEDQTGQASIELPYLVYRQEVERSPYGTRAGGSAKVLRSNWLLSSYATDLDEAIANANTAVNAVIDGTFTTTDGYTTTACELTGFMPLFEREGPNYVVHARILWERSR